MILKFDFSYLRKGMDTQLTNQPTGAVAWLGAWCQKIRGFYHQIFMFYTKYKIQILYVKYGKITKTFWSIDIWYYIEYLGVSGSKLIF